MRGVTMATSAASDPLVGHLPSLSPFVIQHARWPVEDATRRNGAPPVSSGMSLPGRVLGQTWKSGAGMATSAASDPLARPAAGALEPVSDRPDGSGQPPQPRFLDGGQPRL